MRQPSTGTHPPRWPRYALKTAALVAIAVTMTSCSNPRVPNAAPTAVRSTPSPSPDDVTPSPTYTETEPADESPTPQDEPTTEEPDTSAPDTAEPADDQDDDSEDSDSGANDSGSSLFGTYSVTIEGTAGSTNFSRDGTLKIVETITTIATTNGVNPLDACLVSGFPGAQPEVGAIWFGSNSACDPDASAADIDMGTVGLDGDTVTVEPDERVAAGLANNFTVASGLLACPYAPVSGSMQLTVDADGGIDGSIDLVGYGGAFCGQTRYRADISGHR
ncbi:hypothetical protein GCM10023322_83280 [Rugosimonospora acidiphila]|uniref:Uncharacterized protein n=1 Tax=Rugosimonospora acidiphila TaxID=556531 RepID=A0ABP9SSR7_9ACTN